MKNEIGENTKTKTPLFSLRAGLLSSGTLDARHFANLKAILTIVNYRFLESIFIILNKLPDCGYVLLKFWKKLFCRLWLKDNTNKGSLQEK